MTRCDLQYISARAPTAQAAAVDMPPAPNKSAAKRSCQILYWPPSATCRRAHHVSPSAAPPLRLSPARRHIQWQQCPPPVSLAVGPADATCAAPLSFVMRLMCLGGGVGVQVATDTRLWLYAQMQQIRVSLQELITVATNRAEAEADVLMPGGQRTAPISY